MTGLFICRYILESGQIHHENDENGANLKFPINSDCETVHIISPVSTIYHNETRLTINEIIYSGETRVNQIVSKDFEIYFTSSVNEILILNWSCTEWGEWNQASDGSCREEMRPINNGAKTVGNIKYRNNNSTCSKSLFIQI